MPADPTAKDSTARPTAGPTRLPAAPSSRANSASDRDNRSRLLHAATDSFAELGYEGTSLRTIADEAGVSFQLITYYFGSKEALWVATVEYLFERYLETGRGLGFTPTANLHEQFHNHLRLLLTDMHQRPQLRKVWIQEYLAGSERYEKVIRPKIKHLHEDLALPYFQDVVRLGIVTRFTAQEIALLWSSVVQNNLVYPYYVELLLGVPADSPKAIEMQVDLVYAILVEDQAATQGDASGAPAADPPAARPPASGPPAADPPAAVLADAATATATATATTPESPGEDSIALVYALEGSKTLTPADNRVKQLELENSRLKQIVGTLSLEKQLLIDRLASVERMKSKRRSEGV